MGRCLEAPHRLKAALKDIAGLLGERPIAVCREMTKMHQEVFRGTAAAAAAHFEIPRGEITLVIGGRGDEAEAAPAPSEGVEARLRELKAAGAGARDAVAQVVAETGRPRREVYRAWLDSLT